MNSCPEDVQSYMRVFLVYVNFSCLLAFVAAGTIATAPFSTAAPHADTVATAWREEIPLPVYPDAELVDLYKKTWEIAAREGQKGPGGAACLPLSGRELLRNGCLDLGHLFHGPVFQVCAQVLPRQGEPG